MLADYFDGDSDHFWITDDDEEEGPVGVAYCAPELMTNGTWNLLFIAVRAECQEKGRGAALMHYVEQTLTTRGARLLLVEMSGLPEFKRTRAFYCKCGYGEETRIRDFYGAGVDKIVCCKALAA